MKSLKWLLLLCTVLGFSAQQASAQYWYYFTFRGVSYEKDGSGNIVAVPVTDQTFLQDRATQGGISTNGLAIIYHIGGDEKGDTVEIVNKNNLALRLAFQFGLWFGDDPTLDRTALTNSTLTEVRRIDYVYTLETSTYTKPNSHSVGASLTTKRYVSDGNGGVRPTIEGALQYTVNPQNGNSTKVIVGNFTLGAPLP